MADNELSMLSPVSLATFFASYWEQQPLHIERSAVSALIELVDLPAIETLLSTQPVYFPGVQLTQSGKTIDVASYTDEQSAILPSRLLEYHAEGATIVLSQAQKLFPPLAHLCREVVRTLKMRCQANVYVSPPGNKGFNAHYDSHDVFILQVSGAKTFNFYPSTVELPCPEESFDATRLQPSPIDASVALSAGDTLYIPRGVVHDAVADSQAPSVHVTLGVYPMLMRDVLIESIHSLAQQDSRFRQSVDRFQYGAQSGEAQALQVNDSLHVNLQALAKQLQETMNTTDAMNQILANHYDELALNTTGDCTGGLTFGGNGVTADTSQQGGSRLNLREHTLISHERHGGDLKLRTFGQILEFSEPSSSVVEMLLEQRHLDLDQVTSLSSDQRDAMIRSLVQANLVLPG